MLTLNLGALSYVRISKAKITKDTLNMKFSFVKLFFDEYGLTCKVPCLSYPKIL